MTLHLKNILACCLAGLTLSCITVLPVSANRNSDSTVEEATAAASETFDDGVLTYAYVDGGVEIQSCDSSILSVSIMDEIDGYKIVSIADGAFYSCTSLQSVSFGKNVRTLGEAVFMDCTSLKRVEIPETIEEIGPYTFYGCVSLEDITLPDNMTTLPDGMFYNCSVLQDIDLPDSLESIGYASFYGCSLLNNLTLPEGLTSLGEYAFGECYSFTNITLPASLETLGGASFYGCIGLKDFYIPKTLTSLGSLSFLGCTSLSEFIVEEGHGTYTTQDGVLYNTDMTTLYAYPCGKEGTSFTIPDGVKTIHDAAFFSALLEEVIFPDSLENIGGGAFEYCESLRSVTLPNSVRYIYENAFADCTALRSVTLPESLAGIGDYAFYACPNLKEVTIPDGCTTIGDYAFGFTDGTEENEDGTLIPVEIEDFRMYANSGTAAQKWASSSGISFKSLNFDIMKFVWIAVGVLAAALIIFLLVRVIRKNQLTAEERKALLEDDDEDEDDENYEGILSGTEDDADGTFISTGETYGEFLHDMTAGAVESTDTKNDKSDEE